MGRPDFSPWSGFIMGRALVGVVLAALLVGGLWAASTMMPPKGLSLLPSDQSASVDKNFSGSKQIGPWALACDTREKHAAANANDKTFGRCRLVLIYRRSDNTKQIVMVLNFRILANRGNLGLIAALPPVLKKGDILDLVWGKKSMKLPVSFCREKVECVAVIGLTRQAEADLTSGPNAVLALPPGPDGKRAAIRVPLAGLKDAIAAMRRAES
jgi:invasion protein IalB